MNLEEIRIFCLGKKGVTESFPFDETTLVFKVMGKMFALVNLDGDLTINLKCDPEKAIELRERYMCVQSGYHMNKNHWNTVSMDGSIGNSLVREWITESYELVASKLPKKIKQELAEA